MAKFLYYASSISRTRRSLRVTLLCAGEQLEQSDCLERLKEELKLLRPLLLLLHYLWPTVVAPSSPFELRLVYPKALHHHEGLSLTFTTSPPEPPSWRPSYPPHDSQRRASSAPLPARSAPPSPPATKAPAQVRTAFKRTTPTHPRKQPMYRKPTRPASALWAIRTSHSKS
jgi:hypothetical protein